MARSPRQIASYSNRATLLLLDGQINVRELLRRFGETLPIEEALVQLEQEGLIHPKAAPGEEEPEPESEDFDNALPAFDQDPLFDPRMDHITEEGLVMTAPQEPLLELDDVPSRAPAQVPAPAPRKEPMLVEAQAALTPMDEPLVAESKLLPGPALDDDEIVGGPSGASEPAPPKPSLGQRFRALGTHGKVVGLAGIVLGLLVALTVWVSGLRPEVERRAAEALGVPVRVKSLGMAIAHGPALALDNVTIQTPAPVVLRRVELMPDLRRGLSLSAFRVRVDDVSLKPSELSALVQLLGRSENVGEVVFTGLGVQLGSLQIGGLAGSVERDAEGLVQIKLANPAGGLSLAARPAGASLAITVSASPGTLPFLGKPQIGTVDLRGTLGDAGLRGAELGMTGYGGKFDGTLAMDWAGPVSLESRLRLVAVGMAQVSKALFERGGFSAGIATGSMTLRAKAARWEELTRIDELEASFVIERGVLKGFDLGSALRERSPRPVTGGETRFESLRGHLDAGARQLRLMIDRLDSGALTASGQLTVDSFQSLQGSLYASVQVPGRGALNYPAQLGGTVAQPSIQLRLPAAAMTGPLPGGADRSVER